eukprot:m.9091 g.9091  ORF g.9091 m.9091 type:complete len:355 (+) comp6268_c0_seq1:310-1374(+)
MISVKVFIVSNNLGRYLPFSSHVHSSYLQTSINSIYTNFSRNIPDVKACKTSMRKKPPPSWYKKSAGRPSQSTKRIPSEGERSRTAASLHHNEGKRAVRTNGYPTTKKAKSLRLLKKASERRNTNVAAIQENGWLSDSHITMMLSLLMNLRQDIFTSNPVEVGPLPTGYSCFMNIHNVKNNHWVLTMLVDKKCLFLIDPLGVSSPKQGKKYIEGDDQFRKRLYWMYGKLLGKDNSIRVFATKAKFQVNDTWSCGYICLYLANYMFSQSDKFSSWKECIKSLTKLKIRPTQLRKWITTCLQKAELQVIEYSTKEEHGLRKSVFCTFEIQFQESDKQDKHSSNNNCQHVTIIEDDK